MTNQRDSSDLLVPIENAILSAESEANFEEWLSADPKLPQNVRDRHRRRAEGARIYMDHLIRRRDAGETHEVMF